MSIVDDIYDKHIAWAVSMEIAEFCISRAEEEAAKREGREHAEQIVSEVIAACIAAVEHDIECRFVCDPDTDERDCTCHYLRIVARLRQVQP